MRVLVGACDDVLIRWCYLKTSVFLNGPHSCFVNISNSTDYCPIKDSFDISVNKFSIVLINIIFNALSHIFGKYQSFLNVCCVIRCVFIPRSLLWLQHQHLHSSYPTPFYSLNERLFVTKFFQKHFRWKCTMEKTKSISVFQQSRTVKNKL